MPSLIFEKASRGLATVALSSLLLLPSIGWANSPEPKQEEHINYRLAFSFEGNYLAAYVAGLSRDTAAAATYYREALRDDPNNKMLGERAFIAFLTNDNMAEAFQLAEQILKRDKNNGLARLAIGVRDFRAKEYKASRTRFASQAKQTNPDIANILMTAWSWIAEGNYAKAQSTVAQLKGTRGLDVFRDYHAGLMALAAGKKDDAERFLKTAYELDSRTLRIVEAYGRTLSQSGNNARATSVFESFKKIAPMQTTVRWALKELKDNKTLPAMLHSANEGASEVLYSLGSAGSMQGEELPAVVYLRLALYLDPQNMMAKIALADNYERIQQLDQSVEILKTIPKDSFLYTDAVIQRAYGLEQLDRAPEAEAILAELNTSNGKNAEVALALGSILRVRGAKEKDPEKSKQFYLASAESYTKALDLMKDEERNNWYILFLRGTCYERAKKWDKAEADLKQSLALAPDDQPQGRAQVMNYLAYSWVDSNTNIDEAFKLLQGAIELSPRDGMIIDSLGWAYYRLGRYDDAVRELEKAIEYKPGDPTINDHLGDAYWKVGRKTEAVFQWNHARDSNPEPEDLEKILKKIKDGLR
ncbi:tetratricopeptide repeat protein [Microvirga sp. W0021]|uniref:Tetratricopeptide repeat protein n=1 Tax=Hohaiivirga grylli TaxID=3133970 RepID=A0ABV0BHF0_9HYPH